MSNVIDISNYKCLTCSKCLISCDTNTLKECNKYDKRINKIDKKITVIMNTYRRSDKYLAEAIESFLRQTYKNCILQITNTHPVPLKLNKKYENIIIYNIKDIFGQYPRHAVWSLFRIETPYWTILDDDDIILPSYLEEFNEIIKRFPNEYIQIIRNKRLFDDAGKVSTMICGGWTGRLLSRFKIKDFERYLKIKPFNSYQGIDNYLTWYVHSGKKITADLPPTYINRRQRDIAHVYKRRDNNLNVVQKRISESKRKVYAEKRSEVITPYWECDYDKKYKGDI